ncbi:WXG100 family type VII secretion target [Nocardia sp. CC201C]|uniref:WXG100 family type VII secretion target n=1 Tax=Nocardia sp. CC201C TaxID=3044575 RepID=UPI0024A82E82|nr:WXG100 family type VII secretion target [Nocardia sp. CC201C]
MTYTVSAVRSWRPESLADRAAILATGADHMVLTLDAAWREADQIASGGWTGAAGSAAYERIQREHRMGMRIVTAVRDVVDALRSAAASLRSVRDHAIGTVDAAIADGFTVGDDWQVGPTPQDKSEDLRANHIAWISSALRQLTDVDRSVAMALDAKMDEVRALREDAATGREYVPPASTAQMSAAEVQALIDDPRFREWVDHHPDAAKALLDEAVDSGKLDPATKFYSSFLRGYWQREALEQAGIDPAAWRPELGAEANRDTIVKVYEYYGRLFLDRPELQWAGMANMIGPSFAGGFFDLDMMQELTSLEGRSPLPFLIGGLPPMLGTDSGPGLPAEEIRFYESSLLGMQKEIFTDQAAMHEAYLTGGTAEIDRMSRAGLLDPNATGAWHQIHDGYVRNDQSLIAEGNQRLLWREQWQIIADDYDRMRERPATGELVTWGMTAVGAPSIPGAQSFPEVFPKSVDAPGPLPGTIVTPLPDGNISYRDQRWDLITQDTLPAYQRLLADDPARARQLIASDFETRMDEQRLANRRDDIMKQFATQWGYER